jgi:hypothetical protein
MRQRRAMCAGFAGGFASLSGAADSAQDEMKCDYLVFLDSPSSRLRRALFAGGEKWSGRWESNPRMQLGKLPFNHCTTPA